MGAAKLHTMNTLYGDLIAEALRDGMDWERVHITDSVSPAEVLGLAVGSQCAHVVQTKNPFFANDLNSVALLAAQPSALVQFPAAAILAPANCDEKTNAGLTIFDQAFRASREKSQLLQNVEATLEQRSISGSLIADVIVIADELVTNAMFNAPFVDLENTKPGAERKESIEMADGKSARLFLGADQNRLVVGCMDLFGTLNVNKLFKRIKNCYDTTLGDNINFSGSGGAGIGLYMVFNSSASYFAEVKVGSYTIICCTVPLRMSSRARLNIAKNLHCISYK